MTQFPSLEGFGPTRQTLHLYAQAIGVIPRTHAKSHPKWWHISLRVTPHGLRTTDMDLPGGEKFWLELDLKHHLAAIHTSYGGTQAFSLGDGLTGTQFGDQVITAVSKLGLEGEYARAKFESDEPRAYEPAKAEAFLTALTTAHHVMHKHRSRLTGNIGPVQFWPHGFDLAFEWFGTRVETYEEHGEVTEYPSQINMGFYTAGDPYFYSNPWPFEGDKLLDKALPDGAKWFTDGWEGSIFPYSELIGDDNGPARLLEYARTVYDVASPTLLVD